jgi:hypothetical protein
MNLRALHVVLVAAALGTACAKAQARSEPELPPLDVPAAPARVIAPLESEPLPAPAVAVDETPARPRPRPARPSRTESRAGDAARVETTKPAESSSEAPRSTETTGEGAPLMTLQPGREAAFERQIRDTLVKASGDLGRVNYAVLGAGGRNQYDTAKRFIEQGHEALRAKNLVFAENLADKAAVLAAILLGQ